MRHTFIMPSTSLSNSLDTVLMECFVQSCITSRAASSLGFAGKEDGLKVQDPSSTERGWF